MRLFLALADSLDILFPLWMRVRYLIQSSISCAIRSGEGRAAVYPSSPVRGSLVRLLKRKIPKARNLWDFDSDQAGWIAALT